MTVRIRRKLESETLHLPELSPLIGKYVEIIVLEEVLSDYDDWDAVVQKARDLEDYDFDVLIPDDATPQGRISGSLPPDAPLQEFDRVLDEFNAGPAVPLLPADRSRADIYADHD